MAANTLASELARVQNIVRELEANMGNHQDLPPAAWAICGELASRVDRSLRIARSWSESPAGCPDGDGDGAGANAAHSKRRKGTMTPGVRKQVRVPSVRDYAAALDDGFSWRKYGQKEILGAKYPRSYFRCTHRNTRSCPATKQVQRADADPLLFHVVYHGAHACVQAADQLQPQPPHGHEQSSPRVMETGGGIQPLSFASTHAAAGADFGGCYPLLSPTSFDFEWQLWSSQAAGVGAVEFEHQFEDFFSGPPDAFQWDVPQDLYAAN